MCAMNPRLLRPLASGFNPKSLPGFVYWLDASQSSTITVSTGVSEWRDAAGGAIKASQATGSAQPAYQTAVQNGRNAVYFDGSNDSMSLGDLSASFPSAATAIFAYKPSRNDTYSLYTTTDNSAFWAYPTARTYIGTFKGTRLNNVASPLMPTDNSAVVAVVSSSSGYRVYINNVLAHSEAADYLAGTNHRIGQNNLGTIMKGWVYEGIFTASALSEANLTRAYQYLQKKWGIGRPTASNADAQDWIDRVYANGGAVGETTASAVNTFCNAIDAASIRDRFFRLNLFCGTGLNAALVPLYRGPSRTGTQYGNLTDTNNGPFVSGSYEETGASGGLISNRTTQYLNTGLKMDALPQADRHLSASFDASTFVNTSDYLIGADNTGCGGNAFWGILVGGAALTQAMVRAQAAAANSTAFNVSGRQQIIVSGNGAASAYLNGAFAVTGIGGAFTAPSLDVFVFAANRCGSPIFAGMRLQSYSIGAAMTAPQASSFYTAVSAFQSAMSRT